MDPDGSSRAGPMHSWICMPTWRCAHVVIVGRTPRMAVGVDQFPITLADAGPISQPRMLPVTPLLLRPPFLRC
jgi:hypothetical protein